MKISVSHQFLPKRSSCRAGVVMDHFGVGFETGQHMIAENLELPVKSGDVVLFTGPSGSGKSSLMRAVAEQLEGVCRIDELDLGHDILVERFTQPIDEALGLLAQCGLGEARLLLRTPAELSDGQRYRFRLACGIASDRKWIVADEFTAALDRTLAKVIAFNVRKLASRRGQGFLLATTHDDIVDDLNPDVLVWCELDGTVRVDRREVKKKSSASPESCPSRPDRNAIGRTLLVGITAAIN